jgi:acetate CoA/acetoacetate CoA-transferase alpha subunit
LPRKSCIEEKDKKQCTAKQHTEKKEVYMKNKLTDYTTAVSHINDGDSVMFCGFIGVGTPEGIIDAIIQKGVKDLTIIGNDTGRPGVGVSRLIAAGLVKKAIVSHIGTNPQTGELMNSGGMEVELVPQGTLAERIRAGGFGLGGILTPTGIGTEVAGSKQVINVDGKDYLLEKPLRARIGIIRGSVVDKAGNIMYKGTTRNFGPLLAPACDIVIAEAEELAEAGEIPPENVVTPGIFVDYIIDATGGKN